MSREKPIGKPVISKSAVDKVLNTVDFSKEDVPAFVRDNNMKYILILTAIIVSPIISIGLLLPPSLSFFFFLFGGGIGVFFSAIAAFKLHQLRREWIMKEHPALLEAPTTAIKAEPTHDTRSDKERVVDNLAALHEAFGECANIVTKDMKTNVISARDNIDYIVNDYLDNDLKNHIVKKFVIVDIKQYTNVITTFMKVRNRKSKDQKEQDKIKELDSKLASFLDTISDHIKVIKEHAIEEDTKNFELDMRVAYRIIDENKKALNTQIAKRMMQESTADEQLH